MNHYVGEVDQFSEGMFKIIDINGISIGIYLKEGRFLALRNQCPHRLAPVCKGTVDGTMLPSDSCEYQFGMEGDVLKCPWHGWEFELTTGKALFGISNRKIMNYPIEEKDGKLYINV